MANFMKAYRHIFIQLNSHALNHHRAASLYAPGALGLDKYVSTREKVSTNMYGLSDKFRSKMEEFVGAESKNMIFTDDLKNMVHLGKANDLDLLKKMILKFNEQNKELRFGSFIFGPVVMRMLHYLDKPLEAFQIFEENNNSGFFEQVISYQILMDLLYKHEKYEEALKVFEYAQSKQTNMTKYPKHLVVLAMACCYKQNTKESFTYATQLWTLLSEVGHIPMRRAVTFFAGLALNQGAPHVGLEVVGTLKNQLYITVRVIKMICLAELDRPEDTLPVMRSVLDYDTPTETKITFTTESIQKVKKSVDRKNDKDIKREFNQIVKGLESRILIDNKTLDSLLCAEIQQNINTQAQESRLHSSFQNPQTRYHRQSYSRVGLSDNAY